MPIAEAEVKAGKEAGEPALIFFTAKSEADVPTQVRNVCGLKQVSDTPQVGDESRRFPPRVEEAAASWSLGRRRVV